MKTTIGILAFIAAAILAIFLFVWYGNRIELRSGEIAIMIKKTGENLPLGEIIATDSAYKGVQLEALGEGRHFYNSYTWDWQIVPITDIPSGKFGVLVRKFGHDLPHGEIIAPDEKHKGIVREILGTGKHRVNPYAYSVKIFDDIKILPGNVGVVTALSGQDVFAQVGNDFAENRGFLVAAGRKGVQKTILKEGTHRINPYMYSVAIVNIQSQRHEFSGEDAINFLSVDGFNVSLEGTVEFNILPEAAPRLTHEVGDMEDILKKIILPAVRGFTRIEGSKKSSTDFIIGESRQLFQNDLEEFLRENSKNWGVAINSVLIRDIIPPQEIAGLVRQRELAKQEANKFKQQIEQSRSATELEKQKMLALQNSEKVQAETQKITQTIATQQEQMEKVIAAQTELEVAEIALQTTETAAQARLKLAEADRQVISERNRAVAEILKANINAYGSADNYVHALLYQKIAPRLQALQLNQNSGSYFGLPLKGE